MMIAWLKSKENVSLVSRKYYTIFGLWITGIIIMATFQFFGWLYQQEPIGRRVLAIPASQALKIRIDSWENREYEFAYEANINYVSGRKGPYATLRIYNVKTPSGQIVSVRWNDRITTPVAFLKATDLDLPKGGGGIERLWWGSGIHGVTVAEDEFGFTSSYLSPINVDDDYEPEFFIHQRADVNRRAMPIAPGTYLVDFNRNRGKWMLSNYGGFRAFFSIGSNIRICQKLVLLALLMLTLLILQKSTQRRRTMIEVAVLGCFILVISLTIPIGPILVLLAMIYPILALIELHKKTFDKKIEN